MSEKYKNLKVKELQELLQKNGLPYSGKKEDLVDRLVKNDERKALESLEKEFELDDDLDDSKINLNDIPQDIFTPIPLEKAPPIAQKESVLSDDEEVEFIISKKSPVTTAAPKEKPTANTTTTTATAVTKLANNPSKSVPTSTKITTSGSKTISNSTNSTTTTVTATATVTTSFTFTPITFDKKPTANTTATATVTKSKAIAPEKKIVKSQLNEATEKLKLEAQRRLLRSKRFGVKLDEKEMKEIRAARFGIAPTTAAAADGKTKKAENNKENGKTSSKPSTQDILKKRAERFGLPVVEEKKQVVVDEKKTKSKKGNKKTVEPEAKTKKKIPIASNNNAKGKAGKITKKIMNAATPSINSKKKTTTSQTTTRADLLKQKTMKKMLEKADIVKDKKTIIHQRKANTINKNNSSVSAKQGDRVVTFETNSAPVTANKKRTAETNNNNNKNPKTPPKIVIQHLPTGKVVFVDGVPVKMKDKNNNNSATRKRERGFEKVRQQPQLAETHTNKRRRR